MNTSLDNDFKQRLIIHLFMFITIINGMICDQIHSQAYEKKIVTEKRFQSSGQLYEVYLRNQNNTIYNGHVLVNSGFDKMLNWIFDAEVDKGRRTLAERSPRFKLGGNKFKLGERFAFRRRLQFALLPIMYKMGVMTTLLTGLTVLVLKGLTIGVILLIFAFGNYFSKFNKYPNHGAQPIHVHVHSQDGLSKVTSFPHGVGLGPWDRMDGGETNSASLGDQDPESYRRRFIPNSADLMKFKPSFKSDFAGGAF